MSTVNISTINHERCLSIVKELCAEGVEKNSQATAAGDYNLYTVVLLGDSLPKSVMSDLQDFEEQTVFITSVFEAVANCCEFRIVYGSEIGSDVYGGAAKYLVGVGIANGHVNIPE